MFLFMFLFMLLFMTFYQCFFIMFLNKCIGKISIIYYVLSHWIHSISRQMHCNWGNLYHLLCAFSFYFLTKSIFFENTITSSTRSYWGNPYHLLCASPFYFLTSSIFFENTVTDSIRSYWENPYHLLCASPSGSFYSPAGALPLGKPLLFTMCFPILFLDGLDFLWKHGYGLNPLLLGKPLPFTMCFPILFPGGRTGETPIIYYVLPHRVPRRAHSHWGNLYYLMGASPLDRVIGETSIIYYVLPHPILRRAPWGHPYYLLCASPSDRVLRRAHCHWGNLYYLVGASPVIDVRGLAPTLIMVGAKPFLGTLGKPLLFSRCFPIKFPGERIGER